jgi:prepilin-type processing-associated H-X9-DG protein
MFKSEVSGDLAYMNLWTLPKDLVTDLPTRAKLCLSNTRTTFGPTNDCVVYEDAGALLIREIKPMDPAIARKLLAMEAKRKAIFDAKQAATGLIVYAADNDVLPGAEGWENKVGPYFKNTDFLRDFNYTFKGGSMSSIQDPSSTELGFIVGPGGRAVAYCDGHVKWIPNP